MPLGCQNSRGMRSCHKYSSLGTWKPTPQRGQLTLNRHSSQVWILDSGTCSTFLVLIRFLTFHVATDLLTRLGLSFSPIGATRGQLTSSFGCQ